MYLLNFYAFDTNDALYRAFWIYSVIKNFLIFLLLYINVHSFNSTSIANDIDYAFQTLLKSGYSFYVTLHFNNIYGTKIRE